LKVFLSWSGDLSQTIAQALHEWLPFVLQAVEPWMSSADIEVGTRWSSELMLQLQESRFGIICLTPENLHAPWVLFEAGTLSKSLERAYVVPFLFGAKAGDLKGPLVQFQVVTATKKDVFKLIQVLNRALGESALDDRRLKQSFETWWPLFEEQMATLLRQTALPEEDHRVLVSHEIGHLLLGQRSLSADEQEVLAKLVTALSGKPERKVTTVEDISERDRIFIVHGHEHGTMETVARFVEHLGPMAIVLHERPNEGRTIIEKFEVHSGAQYAVVLLTGDDRGGAKDCPFQSQSPRARQNVIMELGYFLAKLGRNRVCVLRQNGVEIPSDISGVLYIELDAESSWKWKLAKELKTAGLRIDLNNAV